jgi:putative membrane-bound dehydrogenase-like protein
MRLLSTTCCFGFCWFSANAAEADLKKSGNVPPRISKLGAEQEAGILKDVKVADGFDVSLFATAAEANYPVYVAAAPGGDLYVASDGNGSLGRAAQRGRIIRLRDADRDGRADQATEFVKEVDSPRGMVWDHDRLYVVHPPDVSCFIDADGDGLAEKKETLITGIAFGFKDRPADHTTNGLSLGIDGWLYISGGDFGFKDAVGTDGRHLQHRAGGVIRFRPDGSGMEIFSTGTRNILGTPISPLLDLFARDNTNDGGGWDVRFHHFTGLEDHGYPRMYINFGEEIVQPLADYGGGSGCGSAYLSEPGIPEKWNNAPLTCDWGTGALWHHSVKPEGATFKETAKPQALIRMTRPTDADVDGMSAIYQASWKGATFNWDGPDVGYIVRVTPKDFKPEPLPDFSKAGEAELLRLLESASQVRTLEAQRALLRRPGTAGMKDALLALAGNPAKPLPARVAALYALTQRAVKAGSADSIVKAVTPLAAEPGLQRFVLRALGDAGLDGFSSGKTTAPVDLYAAGLRSPDPRTRLEAVIGATRQNMKGLAPQIATQLGDADPVLAHTAFRSLAMLQAAEACFAVIDNASAAPAQRAGALRGLMRMHLPEVVDGLIARLSSAPTPAARSGLLGALCRLYFHEGEWNGDSWGTRPDTRGPYYQPEAWSQMPKIEAALKAELANGKPETMAAFISEMRRNRIELNESLQSLVMLAKKDPALLPDLVAQLATAETIPADLIPYLIAALKEPSSDLTKARAVVVLSKTDSKEACLASLGVLARLNEIKGTEAAKNAITAFLTAPKLENHHQLLEEQAAKMDGAVSLWADAGLLALSARKAGSPESRELSQVALDHGWADAKRRVQILHAIEATGFHGLDDQVRAAMDAPDAAVAEAAKKAAKTLKLEKKGEDKTPLVSTLKPEEVVAAVLKTRGDVELGKQMFTRQSCTSCHAAGLDEPQKGPYLGNIAQTYSRGDLAVNIVDPGKTIAQGFATELFTLKEGPPQMGFITFESADLVKARNIAGQEFTWKTADIVKRDKLPNSLMPPGLVNNLTVREFASLLDYLESLSNK